MAGLHGSVEHERHRGGAHRHCGDGPFRACDEHCEAGWGGSRRRVEGLVVGEREHCCVHGRGAEERCPWGCDVGDFLVGERFGGGGADVLNRIRWRHCVVEAHCLAGLHGSVEHERHRGGAHRHCGDGPFRACDEHCEAGWGGSRRRVEGLVVGEREHCCVNDRAEKGRRRGVQRHVRHCVGPEGRHCVGRCGRVAQRRAAVGHLDRVSNQHALGQSQCDGSPAHDRRCRQRCGITAHNDLEVEVGRHPRLVKILIEGQHQRVGVHYRVCERRCGVVDADMLHHARRDRIDGAHVVDFAIAEDAHRQHSLAGVAGIDHLDARAGWRTVVGIRVVASGSGPTHDPVSVLQRGDRPARRDEEALFVAVAVVAHESRFVGSRVDRVFDYPGDSPVGAALFICFRVEWASGTIVEKQQVAVVEESRCVLPAEDVVGVTHNGDEIVRPRRSVPVAVTEFPYYIAGCSVDPEYLRTASERGNDIAVIEDLQRVQMWLFAF